uniref:Variant surface glycoprotein 1125.4295 n=1 Tax=Trypanosoma brucei TaxID=5691 RepID=A0A1J0RAF2_9TRYP|nr:variant surface glycoprotein 1125.4295 [Trypanosoma brucei]
MAQPKSLRRWGTIQNLVLAVVALTTATVTSKATIAQGANKHEHAALCAVIALATAELKAPPEGKADEASYGIVNNLNFSSASKEWQSSFYKDGSTAQVHAAATDAHKKIAGYEQYWQDWKAAASAVGASSKPPELTETKVTTLNEHARGLAHSKLKRIAEAAKQAKDSTSALTELKTEIDTDAEKKRLIAAIFGKEDSSASTVTRDTAFGAAPNNDRTVACVADETAGNAKTAAAQLACLCTKGVTMASALTQPCTKAAEGGTGWNSGSTPLNANDVKAATQTCPSLAGTEITPELLEATLNNVRQLIHVDSGSGYIGAYEATGCNGATNAGVCVKLDSYNNNPTAASFNKLGWPTVLQQLAAKLRNRAKYNIAVASINEALKAASEEAISAVKTAAEEAKLQQEERAKDQFGVQTNSKAVGEKQKQCEKYKDNKTACENAKCKWEGGNNEKGECEVDETQVSERTNTGEEGAAGETTDKCGEAKTPEECAKVTGTKPEGKVAVCGWIDYIDGKGKVEPACRSSISFLNKKCAPISAIFVNSLYFDNSKDFAQFHEIYEIDEALYF